MKRKLVDYKAWRDKAVLNAKVRKSYAEPEEDPYVNVALQIVKLREKNCLTQSQLARKVRSSQQAIARMESLTYRGYSMGTLEKIAKAFHKRLAVHFV